jgi:hypothetical protein
MKRAIANMKEQGLDEYIDIMEPFLKQFRRSSNAKGGFDERQAMIERY